MWQDRIARTLVAWVWRCGGWRVDVWGASRLDRFLEELACSWFVYACIARFEVCRCSLLCRCERRLRKWIGRFRVQWYDAIEFWEEWIGSVSNLIFFDSFASISLGLWLTVSGIHSSGKGASEVRWSCSTAEKIARQALTRGNCFVVSDIL